MPWPKPNWRVFNITDGMAVFLLVCACLYAWQKPIWDWDVIPYLALAKNLQGMEWQQAHAWVYAWVETLPAFWRDDLVAREFYRTAVAADAESLRQVGVFYQARLGYYGALAGLEGLGLSATHAVQMVGLLGQVLLGGVVWLWLRGNATGLWWQRVLWMLFYAFLLFNPTVMKLARWSSPDGLAVALLVAGVYGAWVYKRWWTALPWLLMVVIRPNTALWLMPVGLWALVFARGLVLPLLGAGVVAGSLLVALPNYPLAVVWQHTFGFPYVYPAGVRLEWTWDVYQATLENRLAKLHGRDLWVWGIMAGGVVWVWAKQASARWLATALVLGACLQLLAFPAFWERFYGGHAVAVLLLAITTQTGKRKP